LQHNYHEQVFFENHRITQTVLSAAARAGLKRVFVASSAVVYREGADVPLSEASVLLHPEDKFVSGYAWSKITDELLGHWYSMDASIDVVVGRFTNVYGPEGVARQSPTTVVHAIARRAFMASAEGVLTVWGDGTPRRSFLHADDAARAAVYVLFAGERQGIYNLDSGETVTISDLACGIRDLVNPQLDISFEGTEYGKSRVLDPSRLQGLGFVPAHSLSSGIADMVSECRRMGL
jgi:GDP-L-fucose synthase